MRHDAGGGLAGTLLGEVLPGGYAFYSLRRRGDLPLSVGGDSAAAQALRVVGDVCLHRHCAGWVLLCLEEGCSGLGTVWCAVQRRVQCAARRTLVALIPAVTDLDQLKSHPAVARLLAWNPSSIVGVKFDRDEMTIWVDRGNLREACALLRDDAECAFNFLSDVTCVDWYPAEPRFEVIYHLLSIPKKERVRLKVRVDSASPAVESLTSLWPGANYFEREVFALFGIRFTELPYRGRLLMAEGWEGHPLGKDYPVEGYRYPWVTLRPLLCLSPARIEP